ncbi:thioredoxin domain-containing protein [Candidatus Parcubacteria bacterium]|jgi:protein-disulfide isomerase|nr:thioredoxin domain-containing protein [Candidatus Parcubacteria bacterium]MBT3949072.1 thioredoxin domain-containing protein [Candidatus Parcubacteria bacterium]
MTEENNTNQKGILDLLTPQQTFFVGLIGGVLVLCTIGFFILLGIVLKGGVATSGVKSISGSDSEGPKKFSQCLDDGKYADAIKQDFNLGASIGVQGTPATFINGYLVSGALPASAMSDVIDDLFRGEVPFIDDYEALRMDSGDLQKVDMPDLPNAEWIGGKNATVSLVEFSDFECSFCARFTPSVEQVLDQYGDKIKFTYRHFPLSFHPNAQKAAEAFECAKEQGQWKEMHDKLFELSAASNLNIDSYKKAATELGLK